MGSTSFIPKGKMVATDKEEFPDLDFDDAPKKAKGKKGKKGKKIVTTSEPRREELEDDGTAWKGKTSDFFHMSTSDKEEIVNDEMNEFNFIVTQKQWEFIYKFYPEYGENPYELLTWLYTSAK